MVQNLTPPAVAAIQWQNNGLHIRVYYQRVDGFIYEAAWDQNSGWNAGNTKLVQAKIGTPISAIVFAVTQPQIRLYYLDNANVVQEFVFSSGWSKGATLPSTSVSPITSLAAVTWGSGPEIRVYYQRQDSSIQEIAFSSGWSLGNQFKNTAGYPGTSLSAVLSNGNPSIRVYYQAQDLTLHELNWSGGWSEGVIKVSPPPAAGMVAVSWLDASGNNPSIRIYFADNSGDVQELSYNTSTGWVTPPAIPTSVATSFRIPIGAIAWGNGPVNIRVYFQSSSQNQLTEMAWGGSSWSFGTMGF